MGGISISESANVRLSNNTTNCPRAECGGTAYFIEGTINVKSESIELVEGPQWSQDLIERLRLGLPKIIVEQPTDPIAAVAELSPDVAAMISNAVEDGLRNSSVKSNSKNRRKLTWKALGAAYAMMMIDYGNAEKNVESIAQGIAHLCAYIASHGNVP